MYCLSFAMTGRWYSKKWYHYVIMIVSAKNDLIDQLRTQLNFANLQASQVAQTASIREGQIDAVNSLYNRLDTCPVGTTPVYGRVPIFTCNGGCGCQSVQ